MRDSVTHFRTPPGRVAATRRSHSRRSPTPFGADAKLFAKTAFRGTRRLSKATVRSVPPLALYRRKGHGAAFGSLPSKGTIVSARARMQAKLWIQLNLGGSRAQRACPRRGSRDRRRARRARPRFGLVVMVIRPSRRCGPAAASPAGSDRPFYAYIPVVRVRGSGRTCSQRASRGKQRGSGSACSLCTT